MSKPLKFGYEGEGPMIGRRTAYAAYPGVTVQTAADLANLENVDSLYFVVESDHRQFVNTLLLAQLGQVKVVTLDYPVEHHAAYIRLAFAIRFIRCDKNTNVADVPACVANVAHTYIKMVCEYDGDFSAFVAKANEIALLGHTVLLMPDFMTCRPHELGAWMMTAFDQLHPRVRVMPPVHHVLGMP